MMLAAALAAGPLMALAVLALTGAVPLWPAMLLAVVNVLAASLYSMLYRRQQDQLLSDVQRAAAGHAVMQPSGSGTIQRIIRTLAQRSDDLAERLRVEEAIVEALPDPLIILGFGPTILRANAAAHAAFGTEIPSVLRHPELRNAIDRVVAKGTPQDADLSIPVPVMRDVHAAVFRIAGDRMAAVLSDRTRERALERMRADFVANASHELRTPLASLIGFVDTLRGPAADDPPAQARFLQIMAEQGARMNRLIDDLLSLSRIEMTEHRPPTDKIALAELVHLTAASFEPQIAARGITLELSIPAELPLVTGDDDQLSQVLQNLMDNAVKYGRQGGTVRITAMAVPPGGRWPLRPGITVEVADDGPGIPREHLPRLTERFYRVDKGRSRAVGGTGLGLAIVKHIINRHRGRLTIVSREGKGATFTVWLPALQTQAVQPVLERDQPVRL